MLIGLTGYAQHGKDSTAEVLVYEYGFTRYGFADQLKSMALVLNPFVENDYSTRLYTLVHDQGWERAKENKEVRRFLQVLGTEAVRDHLGEDAWVRALEKRLVDDNLISYFYKPRDGKITEDVVISDVRFPNEAGWVTMMGGELWRIHRDNEDGSAFDNGLGVDHPSEQFINQIKADRFITASNLTELGVEVRRHMDDVTDEANLLGRLP